MCLKNMEEEEEIDILGDYDGVSKTEREISNISAGQILSLDYTVHPRWLMDNPEAGDFATDELTIGQEICIENDGTIYSSDDEYEKQSKEVIEEPEWNPDLQGYDEIILEESIPAYAEEIVTNYNPPTIQKSSSRSLLKVNQPNPRSILKVNLPFKFKQTLKVDRELFNKNKKQLKNLQAERKIHEISQQLLINEENEKRIDAIKSKKNSKISKFKQSVKIEIKKGDNIFKKNLLKRKTKSTSSRSRKRSGVIYDENITINHNENEEGCSIRFSNDDREKHEDSIKKVNIGDDESDIEIDIESGEPDLLEFQNSLQNIKLETSDNHIDKNPPAEENLSKKEKNNQNEIFLTNLLSSCSDELKKVLEASDFPKEELTINQHEISDLEQFVHSEFFEGRPTKTPDRYMKIRGHILNCWYNSKPTYLSKTAVRAGLKNCGDVNCISRIHALLEQIGAINFGCEGGFYSFIRPLTTLIVSFMQPTRQQKISNSVSGTSNILGDLEKRSRNKINSYNDSNYTISHIGKDEKRMECPRKDSKIEKKNYELIKCKQFNHNIIAPFKVSITVSTLLCVYLHSLSSKHEVMGFLGGYRSKSVGRNKLCIARYKPCLTSKQSGTMCEMCPISQIEQSTSLQTEGFDLLGWFHSHPLFPPNPSLTDVQTQAEMQLQFSANDDLPFIGLILGCLDMTQKCIYIISDEYPLTCENGTPFELNIEIIKDCTNFSNDVLDVINLIRKDENDFQNILDKFQLVGDKLLQQYGYDKSVLSLFK